MPKCWRSSPADPFVAANRTFSAPYETSAIPTGAAALVPDAAPSHLLSLAARRTISLLPASRAYGDSRRDSFALDPGIHPAAV